MSGRGNKVTFHGAFASKAKAVMREAKRKGSYMIKRKIKGQTRWIVLRDKAR